MRRSILVLALIAPLCYASSASAQAWVPPSAAVPQPPIEGFSIRALSSLPIGEWTYAIGGRRVAIEGRAAASAAGRPVTVEVRHRRGETTDLQTVFEAAGDAARFEVEFPARRSAVYAITAYGAAAGGAPLGQTLWIKTLRPRARRGARGPAVLLLQRGLERLGYATPTGGRFRAGTARAVVAFRKVNSMPRKAVASRAVYSKLLAGRGGFALKYPGAGKHVEFDVSRQVLVLARDGRAERIYHASSGTASTPTVLGSFRFYMKQPGTNAKRMVHSNYFIRGYAIHGYHSVPMGPASHGCIRVPIPNAAAINGWIDLGDPIFVYR